MVIWDTNILALYFSGRLSSDDQIRMNGLVSELSRKKETIGIPAQVWAEFLEAASQEEAEESVKLFKSNAFSLLAYDMRCAIETAEVARQGQTVRKSTKGPKRDRQAVKVDWQIIAIAKVNQARLLLSNDGPMAAEAIRQGLNCMKISELPILIMAGNTRFDLKRISLTDRELSFRHLHGRSCPHREAATFDIFPPPSRKTARTAQAAPRLQRGLFTSAAHLIHSGVLEGTTPKGPGRAGTFPGAAFSFLPFPPDSALSRRPPCPYGELDTSPPFLD